VQPSSSARLAELYARLDAFFAKVHRAHAAAIQCRPGCTDCCRRFSITRVEAALVREAVAALDPAVREAIAGRARRDEDACPALLDDGRCGVYAARPAICRTHGLPIRFTDPDRRALPVVSACEKNFGGVDLAALAGDTLDQRAVSTVLAALEALHAAETGEAIARVPIADLFD
jgi:hypothetical protein